MIKIPSKIDLVGLFEEVSMLTFHNKYDSRMKMTAQQAYRGIDPIFGPRVLEAVEEISKLRDQGVLNVMVNKLPAKSYVAPHIDPIIPTEKQGSLPRIERWHLPIITDPNCLLSGKHLEPGFWHGPVRYWELHDVTGGDFDRIHLLVDLDTPDRIE